jgi:hypothetical protein
MFWFLSTKRPFDRKDAMCHSLFIFIFFIVLIKTLSCLLMPRHLHLALVYLCSIPPSLEPRTCYHVGVEIFIDDEVRETNV